MADFSNHGAVAATTGGGILDPFAGCAKNFPASRMVSLRRIEVNADDAGVGGWVRFTITVNDALTGANIITWQTLLLIPGTGAAQQDVGDRQIFFNSGVNGAVMAATVEGQNGAERASMNISGQLN